MKSYHKLLVPLFLLGTSGLLSAQPPPPVPPADEIKTGMELFITDPAVLNSPRAGKNGPWHIREALRRIAGRKADGTLADVDQFAKAWFTTWEQNTALAGTAGTFTPRPWVAEALRSAWKDNRIRLIAIVNRIDLTQFPDNDPKRPPLKLGEGRFIYEVMKDASTREPFTLIFEYRLSGDASLENLRKWAMDWHRLGSFSGFDRGYLEALDDLTSRFSAYGMLSQVRTNEFLDLPPVPPPGTKRIWEMREFHFDAGTVALLQGRVNLTPSNDFLGKPEFIAFVETNKAHILAGNPVPFLPDLAGAVSQVPRPEFTWAVPGPGKPPALERAEFIVSFNTCSGCHSGDTRDTAKSGDEGTPFQHIGLRAPQLSNFLNNPVTLAHQLPGDTSNVHDEMGGRKFLLKQYYTGPGASGGADNPKLKAEIKARSIRVH